MKHLCQMQLSFQVDKGSGSCSLSTVLQIQDYKEGDCEINLEFHLLIGKILSPQSLGERERERERGSNCINSRCPN